MWHSPLKECDILLFIRWAALRKDHAWKRVRDNAGPFPGKIRCTHGRAVIHSRFDGRDILVWSHLISSRRHRQRRCRLGSFHFRHCFGVYRYFLYAAGRSLLCGLHWCYSTHLHLCWTGEYAQRCTLVKNAQHSSCRSVVAWPGSVIMRYVLGRDGARNAWLFLVETSFQSGRLDEIFLSRVCSIYRNGITWSIYAGRTVIQWEVKTSQTIVQEELHETWRNPLKFCCLVHFGMLN